MTVAAQADARYVATFTPEAWINMQAVEIDRSGDTEWDVTQAVLANPDYWNQMLSDDPHASFDDTVGVLDNDDTLKDDPWAPGWIHDHRGPFTIRVRRVASEVGQ